MRHAVCSSCGRRFSWSTLNVRLGRVRCPCGGLLEDPGVAARPKISAPKEPPPGAKVAAVEQSSGGEVRTIPEHPPIRILRPNPRKERPQRGPTEACAHCGKVAAGHKHPRGPWRPRWDPDSPIHPAGSPVCWNHGIVTPCHLAGKKHRPYTNALGLLVCRICNERLPEDEDPSAA